MTKHVKNYFKAFGYHLGDFISCEVCGKQSNDIHHVEPRSSFGSTTKDEQDSVSNLIALCRGCHNVAHSFYSRTFKFRLKEIIQKRERGFSYSRTKII